MNNTCLNLRGIFPPIPTSFKKSGDLTLNRVKNNVKYYNRFELGGYVVLGANGEFVLLDEEEKIALIKTVRQSMPSEKLLLAGIGCPSTSNTIRLCHSAAASGTDAALIITPSFYKNKMTDEALLAFFKSVGDASPIPVVLYNMPACTGLDLSPDVVVSLADHPNIIGLKDSGGNITKMGEIIHRVPESFQVLAGSAGFLLPALTIGAVGGILALANVAPSQCLQIQKLFDDGKLDDARLLQNRLTPLNQAITRIGGIPAMKAAMDCLGLYGGPVRGPLLPAGAEEILRVKKLLQDAGIEKIRGGI